MAPIISGIQNTTAALASECGRLEVISEENTASVHTSRSPDGKPYARQAVTLETSSPQPVGGGGQSFTPTFQVGRTTQHPRRLLMDETAASRAFEENLAVLKNSCAMALQILSIGMKT